MNRQEITKNYEGCYFRGVNNLSDIEKNSIDVFDDYLLNLSKGQENIENKLIENGLESWTSETLETGELKITYPGVNATNEYIADLQDSYNYLAVIKGEFQGWNYFDALPIVKVIKIIAVYDRDGKQIR